MNAAADPLQNAERLLEQLEAARAKLEQTEEPDAALELLDDIARLAREAHAEIERAKHQLDG
jgi:exonuclease VII small subunit